MVLLDVFLKSYQREDSLDGDGVFGPAYHQSIEKEKSHIMIALGCPQLQ